jgi:hypothetical protein
MAKPVFEALVFYPFVVDWFKGGFLLLVPENVATNTPQNCVNATS